MILQIKLTDFECPPLQDVDHVVRLPRAADRITEDNLAAMHRVVNSPFDFSVVQCSRDGRKCFNDIFNTFYRYMADLFR